MGEETTQSALQWWRWEWCCFISSDWHHSRPWRSFWLHYCGGQPTDGGGLHAQWSSWSQWPQSWGLCHGGQRHPSEASWNSSSHDQSGSRSTSASGCAQHGPAAKTAEQQHEGVVTERRQCSWESCPKGYGVQQKGGCEVHVCLFVRMIYYPELCWNISNHSVHLFVHQVEEVLGEEPDVKEQLFEVLKQYAADRDVESLAEALPDILITEDHQQLIDSVR